MNLYWSLGEPILVRFTIYIGRDVDLYETVAESTPSILCAKASYAQLPDIPL